MLTAALIGSIALAASAIALAFWGMKRSFGYADKLEEALVVNRLSEKQLAEARVAIAERDHTIDELTTQASRLRAALDLVEGETPPIVSKEKAGASIRQSMDSLRAQATAAAVPKTPLPSVLAGRPGALPPAAPGSVTGGLPDKLPPIATPQAAPRPAAPGSPSGTTVHGAPAKPGDRPK